MNEYNIDFFYMHLFTGPYIYPRIPQKTQEYPRIPKNTPAYPRIPLEYPKIPLECPRIPQNTNNIKILKDLGFLFIFYSVDGDISQKGTLIELLFVLFYISSIFIYIFYYNLF
jgi:hypothetical protein